MNRRKAIRITSLVVSILLLTLFSFQLLWGKLFPYSPFKPGFTRHEMSHIIIYAQDDCGTRESESVDTLLHEIEDFHGLRFLRKPEVLVFHDSLSYLQRSVTKARFYAYPNGSVVVSPWAVREAREGTISMNIYLKHELSHVLLYQHMGFMTAYFHFPRWLLEGIAVYSTNQMGTSWYPSKIQTYADIRKGNFLPPDFFNTEREHEVPLNVQNRTPFMYSEFACIVDYLIATRGKARFMHYVTRLLDSSDPDSVFNEVYGMGFDVCLQDFRQYVDQHD